MLAVLLIDLETKESRGVYYFNADEQTDGWHINFMRRQATMHSFDTGHPMQVKECDRILIERVEA